MLAAALAASEATEVADSSEWKGGAPGDKSVRTPEESEHRQKLAVAKRARKEAKKAAETYRLRCLKEKA
jgi:hypothetical protein